MTIEGLLQIAKPILFNTEMVKAILEDRKTVTRRVVKLPSYVIDQADGRYTLLVEGTGYVNQTLEEIEDYLKKPYKVGDVLYVRETWQECCRSIVHSPIIHNKYCFKASIDSAHYGCIEDCGKICNWKPSIHMPKDAARIFLKVTDVKVERLQDITEEQATKEGCRADSKEYTGAVWGQEDYDEWTAREDFSYLWDSTIKKADLDTYGWYADPYVWVIEFERIQPDKEV